MWEFFKNMVSSNDSVSSKRFAGLLGWMLCLVICIYCTWFAIQAPAIIEILFICSTSLLGIESVTNIWKSK